MLLPLRAWVGTWLHSLASYCRSSHEGRFWIGLAYYGVWHAMASAHGSAFSRSLLSLVLWWPILGRRPVWNTVGRPWNDERLVAFEC
jgi:hypothetical protein